jgi:hypothetical protein
VTPQPSTLNHQPAFLIAPGKSAEIVQNAGLARLGVIKILLWTDMED